MPPPAPLGGSTFGDPVDLRQTSDAATRGSVLESQKKMAAELGMPYQNLRKPVFKRLRPAETAIGNSMPPEKSRNGQLAAERSDQQNCAEFPWESDSRNDFAMRWRASSGLASGARSRRRKGVRHADQIVNTIPRAKMKIRVYSFAPKESKGNY
jgi:hypothetical protein